jgi:hypothetical protein
MGSMKGDGQMVENIPEGLKVKALDIGLGVEVKRRNLVAVPALYRFVNRGRPVSDWLRLGDAHTFLDLQSWKVHRKETGS